MNKKDIEKKISTLDGFFPLTHYDKDQIWEDIERRMKKKGKVRNMYFRYASIAATFLILTLVLMKSTRKDKISYTQTEEVITLNTDALGIMKVESDAMEFIDNSCKTAQNLCESQEFKELKLELDQLDQEMEHLNRMIGMYGEDEFLIKSKIKIENHKSEITRKLVQILMT